MTVSTPSRPAVYTKELGPSGSRIARTLLGGHAVSIAKAVLEQDDIKDSIVTLLLGKLNDEYTYLCKKNHSSTFRTIPVDQLAHLKLENIVADLQLKDPFLFKILHSITSGNDHRNAVKVGAVHYPGICPAAAILLKERNREMCGLQTLVSLLMFSCHAEKQVIPT